MRMIVGLAFAAAACVCAVSPLSAQRVVNGNFTNGLTGWTIVGAGAQPADATPGPTATAGSSNALDAVDLGLTSLAGCTSTDFQDYPALQARKGGGAGSPPPLADEIPLAMNFAASVVTTNVVAGMANPGGAALRLSSNGSSSPYGVVHGPAAISPMFAATSGEVIAFDWYAEAAGDDFAVVAYLQSEGGGCVQTQVLSSTGTTVLSMTPTGSGANTWQRASVTIPANGNYRFVFVHGTFDRSGGQALGAIMSIANITAGTAQTITFGNPGTQFVGAPYTLSATASSGLAVSFASTTASVCTVSGTTLTLLTTGTCTVVASQPGDGTFAAAMSVSQSFTVSSTPPVIISDTTPVPVRYASEINATVASPVTLPNTTGSLNLRTALRYNFTETEVRYARIECPASVRFLAGSTVVASDPAATTLGSLNGLGTNAITFSVTANTTGLTATDTVTVTGNRSITSTIPASCTYSLYDNPSQAQAGGAEGRIVSVTGAYIAFAPSWQLLSDPTFTSTANVEATPAYTGFVASGDTTTTRAGLAELTYGLVASPPLRIDGNPITLADLMATGGSGTKLVVTGDFSAAANTTGAAFTGAALNRVFLATDDTCTTLATPAASLTETTATFNVGATGFTDDNLCIQPNGVSEIPAADYTAQVQPVAASSSYVVSNSAVLAAGRIVRNGVELQAPLVQLPTGYISRIALTNSGSTARAFAWRFLPASGGSASESNTTTTGALSGTGTIPANGASVIALGDVLGGFGSTPPRGTFIVTAAAPSGSVQGLYQIVNPTNGSISNYVMVRPASN